MNRLDVDRPVLGRYKALSWLCAPKPYGSYLSNQKLQREPRGGKSAPHVVLLTQQSRRFEDLGVIFKIPTNRTLCPTFFQQILSSTKEIISSVRHVVRIPSGKVDPSGRLRGSGHICLQLAPTLAPFFPGKVG